MVGGIGVAVWSEELVRFVADEKKGGFLRGTCVEGK